MFMLAELYILEGNIADARLWLDRVIQTYPNTQAAGDAQTLLEASR